jgi:hypothetical protein
MYKLRDSLVVINHGHLDTFSWADVDLRRHVQAEIFAESHSMKHERHQPHVVKDSVTEMRVVCAIGGEC